MARIHHENMVLVLSDGTVQTGAFLEQRARDRVYAWEHQAEPQLEVNQRYVYTYANRLALCFWSGRGAAPGIT